MSITAPRANGKPSSAPNTNPIEADLQRVDDLLHAELSSAVKTVFAASRHILDAGGKRLRPALVLLSAHACRDDADMVRAVSIAAAVELVHMATLMHDDVIDGADSRRGRKTASAFWGNQVSVLTGDYMLSKATSLLAADGDLRVIQELARATTSMAEGEIAQIESCGETKSLASQYLAIIRDKTAEFTSACCRFGAIVSGAEPPVEDALAGYGLDFGLAFQITDDLLDLVGDPAITGKPSGGDLREGKVTMPIILALQRANPADRMALEHIIHNDGASAADVEFVRKLVLETGAIEAAREAASAHLDSALRRLELLPPSRYRDSLEDLARYTLTREK